MSARYVNLKHLTYVRERPCMVCGTDYGVEAHHLLQPWSGGRGMSLRAGDENTVPLCNKHHRELHERGNEFKFFQVSLGREDDGQFMARLLWLNSPAYERLNR